MRGVSFLSTGVSHGVALVLMGGGFQKKLQDGGVPTMGNPAHPCALLTFSALVIYNIC